MLTPEDLQAIANDLTDIYSDVERECISSIVHRLVSGKGVTQSSVWRMKKLADVGALKRELMQKVSQESRTALPKVEELIEKAMSRSVGLDLDKARKALKETESLTRDELFSSIVEGREFQRILKSATVACRKAMNLTGTKAVQASVASYTRAIDNAYLKMASGNYDMARCVRDAVSEIGSSGIRIVEGKTPKGSSLYRRDGELRTTYSSRRSYPLDAAIRRDLTTQMNRSCAELALADCDKVGTRLVQTSWHIGARPEHERWQGKVFSLDRDGKHPYFYDSQDAGGTGYGDLLGLCGINCYHSFGPYFEGDPIPSEGKPTAEENGKAYREQQTQRSFERSLRALKRQQTALREGGFKEDAGYVQSRVNEVNARYKAFLSETGRKRVSMLDQVSGYHPVKALDPRMTKSSGSKGEPQITRDYTKNVAQAFGTDGYDKMCDMLDGTGNRTIIHLYKQVENTPVIVMDKGTDCFENGKLFLNIGEIKKGSSFEKPYSVAFHEMGHAIEDVLSRKQMGRNSFAFRWRNGRFVAAIKEDAGKVTSDIVESIIREHSPIEYAILSDILEGAAGINLGYGHGKGYWNDRRLASEAFAEMLEAAIANKEALELIEKHLPNARRCFLEMLDDIRKMI